MKTVNNNKNHEISFKNNLDLLCQEFGGGSFYGLEYILEEFFQKTGTKPSVPVNPSVDWYGLCG